VKLRALLNAQVVTEHCNFHLRTLRKIRRFVELEATALGASLECLHDACAYRIPVDCASASGAGMGLWEMFERPGVFMVVKGIDGRHVARFKTRTEQGQRAEVALAHDRNACLEQ
jgi:hypothetical protein